MPAAYGDGYARAIVNGASLRSRPRSSANRWRMVSRRVVAKSDAFPESFSPRAQTWSRTRGDPRDPQSTGERYGRSRPGLEKVRAVAPKPPQNAGTHVGGRCVHETC